MKQFLITFAFIILGVFIVNTFIFGDTGMKSEAKRIGDVMILDLQKVTN